MRWLILGLAACGVRESGPDSAPSPRPSSMSVAQEMEAPEEDRDRSRRGKGRAEKARSVAMLKSVGSAEGADGAAPMLPPAPPPEEASADVRAWFPEAFLWAPEVVTDASGRATLDVTVPDSLTTWRMLALAHDARGQQAGATHSFRSALDSWVELRAPSWLTAGDVWSVPVLVHHEGAGTLGTELSVKGSNGAGVAFNGSSDISLESGQRVLSRYQMAVSRGGDFTVEATLGEVDALREVVPVVPAGRPVVTNRAGLLGASTELALEWPEDALDGTATFELQVFAGSLSMFASELERLQSMRGPVDGALAWYVLQRAEALAMSSRAELDETASRRLRVRVWQRLRTQERRSQDLIGILDALGEDDTESVAQMRTRIVSVLRQSQRGDGTWAPSDTATLSSVLVLTATTAAALPDGEPAMRQRAASALERLARGVTDPYAAAVLVASGLMTEGRAAALREVVAEAVVRHGDGTASLRLERNTRGASDRMPDRVEAAAWAALALQEHDEDAHSRLVGWLMGRWSASMGFEGASVVATRAVAQALPPLGSDLELVVAVQGQEPERRPLSAGSPLRPLRLSLELSTASAGVRISVDPPMPGLAFTSRQQARVPWGEARVPDGLTVELPSPELTAGRPGVLPVSLAAPGGVAIELELGLPAGVEVDVSSLVGHQQLAAVVQVGDVLRLVTRPFEAGSKLELVMPVTASHAGQLSSVPHTVGVAGTASHSQLPPTRWRILPGG